jgi:predicted phosphoribosyltransferase
MFRDRVHAGEVLGREMGRRTLVDPVVLGLPRGGVVVAAGVATALQAPLDVVVVRKLGAPGNPELGIGAVAEGGVTVLNDGLIRRLGVTAAELDEVAAREHAELGRRRVAYRGVGEPESLDGRDAVVVDDGLATGYTARAAIEAARRRGAARVILAVPVASNDTAREISSMVDELVCIESPRMMLGVGGSYRDFRQTSDAEVTIATGDAVLPGTLTVPAGARGVVLFAHGSGSSRHSPRNRAVAGYLETSGLATLLFDLLTPDEGADRAMVFDIPLLGRRLAAVHDGLPGLAAAAGLPVGYFGGS